jgi:hypothetical protein
VFDGIGWVLALQLSPVVFANVLLDSLSVVEVVALIPSSQMALSLSLDVR